MHQNEKRACSASTTVVFLSLKMQFCNNFVLVVVIIALRSLLSTGAECGIPRRLLISPKLDKKRRRNFLVGSTVEPDEIHWQFSKCECAWRRTSNISDTITGAKTNRKNYRLFDMHLCIALLNSRSSEV